jgi:hypothetical protein
MRKGIIAIALSVVVADSVQAAAAPPTERATEQPNRACQVVSPEEAATILGANAKSVSSAKGCTYQIPGQSIQLAIRTEPWAGERDGAFRIFELEKAKWDEGNSHGDNPPMKPEPSVGGEASSVQNRDSFYLLVAVKKTLLEIELRDKGKVIPSALCDKVRLIAKQAASRL